MDEQKKSETTHNPFPTPPLANASNPFPTPPLANRMQMPKPRTYEGKKYYGMADVAHILGVDRRTISRWNLSLIHI